MKLSSTTSMLLLAGGIIALLIGAAIWRSAGPSKYDGFAQCLAEKDAFVYEAWWCSACTQQKDLFGSAWRHVPKKECAPAGQSGSLSLCADDNITATPTWQYPDASTRSGVHPLSELATIYGCELPE